MNIHELSALENESIRAFVQSAADDGLLSGRVLDYGAGREPYRDVVEAAGGTYRPYDRAAWGGNVSGKDVGVGYGLRDEHGEPWDAILSTQTVQYVDDVPWWLDELHDALRVGGALVMTYPSAWPVLRDHLLSFTKLGMERLLDRAGFTVVRHDLRLALPFDGFEIPVGYGVAARV